MLTSIMRIIFLLFFGNVTLAGCMFMLAPTMLMLAEKLRVVQMTLMCEEAAHLNKANDLIWRGKENKFGLQK